ncbi:carbonic anhydrase 1 [Lepeophtheirus salmonis]|uniref:carbonic anhydrase 1 n=1 Tax=Lepeophtheirus salmonis TaxID=72036 RepID=UPI001AE86ECA|nr:carbonic anhydrase 2-like [Lepeophtheirus salmonis]
MITLLLIMKLSHTILICLTIFFRLSVSQLKSPNEKYWDSFDVMKICNSGVKQSPINLEDRSTLKGKGSPITFMNYDVAHNFYMKNTGKTAKLSLKDGSTNVPTITSSHLSNDTYKFAQLHFHWGGMNKYGSEHTLDGFQYPIEVHLVHFNTKYGASIEEALSVANKSDNLAVLGVFFDIIPCTITDLDPLISKLKDIQSEGTKVDVKGLALEKLLPTDLNTFFSYEGSLTTPRCNEVVAWTVFKKKQMISEEQLGEFRKLIGGGEPLVNNYRDIQKLNERKVYLYSA